MKTGEFLYYTNVYYICAIIIATRIMGKELSDKEWELIQTIRNFRKMYPQSVEFELYINHLVAELMFEEEQEEF